MEALLGSFRLPSMPPWARRLIVALLLLGVLGGAALIAGGAIWDKGDAWIETGGTMLALALPGLVVAIAIWTSRVRIVDLEREAAGFLREQVPAALARLAGEPAGAPVRILRSDAFSALYEAPVLHENRLKRLHLGLQLNVYRLNVDLHVREEAFRALGGDDEKLLARVPHTVKGAETQITVVERDRVVSIGAYTFHRVGFDTAVGERRYHTLSAIRPLIRDFLWSEPDRLFILQDLAIMVGSFVQEAGDLFCEDIEAGPDSAPGGTGHRVD